MSRLNDATPEQWNKLRGAYVKSIEETILEEEADWSEAILGDKSNDMVDRPPHYNQGSIEAINYIRQQLGTGFVEYCQGNVIKYLHRWKYKNGLEDLEKAQWYLQRMVDELRKEKE